LILNTKLVNAIEKENKILAKTIIWIQHIHTRYKFLHCKRLHVHV
jgi:hypothetical protein